MMTLLFMICMLFVGLIQLVFPILIIVGIAALLSRN